MCEKKFGVEPGSKASMYFGTCVQTINQYGNVIILFLYSTSPRSNGATDDGTLREVPQASKKTTKIGKV